MSKNSYWSMSSDTNGTCNPNVGFIGLGNIGLPMALNLIEDGFDVTVADLRSEPIETAVAAGATEETDLEHLAQTCDIIEIVVDGDEAVRSVVFEEELFSRMRPGTILIIHSTIRPQTMEELDEAGAEHGVVVMDAAVSGGDTGAKAGTLTIMVGGEPEYLEQCRGLFETIGEDIFHTGPVGSGQAAKLSNNIMTHGNHLLALEAMKLAEAYGIDEETMASVASVSTGGSWIIDNWGFYDRYLEEHTLAGSDELYFFLRHATKDALAAAAEKNVALPLAGLSSEYRPIALAERYQQLIDKDTA